MKIFPTKNYKLDCIDNPEKSIQVLKLNTLESDRLSTTSTDKEFIGIINANHFEIISSDVGIGAFTVVRGELLKDSINVVVSINKPFKVLITLLFVFGIGGISYNVFKIGFPRAIGMLIPLLMFVGFLRFVFLGLLFNRSVNLFFEKFSRIVNVEITQM